MFDCTSMILRACKTPILNRIGSKALPFTKSVLLENTPSMIMTSQPSRNTMILRRKNPVPLHKSHRKPKLMKQSQFYDLDENTDTKPERMVDVVLKSFVPGLGNDGDIVSLKVNQAYNKLLVTGLADYATPENIEYSKKKKENVVEQKKLFTVYEDFLVKFLKRRTVLVMMNLENEWKLEPWHVQVSLRFSGVDVLSPDQIQLPSKPISGPDMDLQDKAFYITLLINQKHTVNMRCKIHHWATSPLDRLPLEAEYWADPGELIFPEDKQYEQPDTAN